MGLGIFPDTGGCPQKALDESGKAAPGGGGARIFFVLAAPHFFTFQKTCLALERRLQFFRSWSPRLQFRSGSANRLEKPGCGGISRAN